MNNILAQLNPDQQQAVTFGNGPLLILAGAGSGKTKTLTHRAAWLVEQKKASPENILLLTFTNKAAEEMKARIKNLSFNNPPLAGTFHSFCTRILKTEGKHIGIDPNFIIYDDHDQLETIKMAMDRLFISTKEIRPKAVKATISGAKNELISSLEYPQYARGFFQENVAKIYLSYQQSLKKFNALDFDDLLLEAVKLFQNHKETLEKYQNRFSYILVDEYQDTNQAQYFLTKALSFKWKNLTVVGDASQSIYSWRGANYRNLMNLKKDFPNLKIINLEQNYRSTQNILDAANKVISKNKNHPILSLWTKNKKGEKIKIIEAENENQEAFFITQKILEFEALGKSFSDIAILYRTNAQSRVVEEALLHAGIAYTLIGGVRFYERREIKDCLAYLRLILNPKDMVSHKRIFKLGKRKFEKFLEVADKLEEENLVDKLTTLEILDNLLEKTEYLNLYDQKNEEDAKRLENIKELRSVASEFKKLDLFLEQVSLVQKEYSSEKEEKNRGAITLMTMHAAKGTEFPIVFIIGMEEGLFPHSQSMFDNESIEEERRLCYVGITRAMERLYLIHCSSRLYFGQRNSNPRSRFLDEIPKYLLE
jgi:DNA helicase II / ATP-dependent DNA helicase PcrA